MPGAAKFSFGLINRQQGLGIGLKLKYPDKTVAGWMGSRVGGMLFKRNSLICSSHQLLPMAISLCGFNLGDPPT